MTMVRRTHRLVNPLDPRNGVEQFQSAFRSVKSFNLIPGSIETADEVTFDIQSLFQANFSFFTSSFSIDEALWFLDDAIARKSFGI